MVLDYEDPATETYQDMLPVINTVVNKHLRRYGGDREELLAQAGLVFAQVYKDYVPERGVFGKRVRFLVGKRLVDHLRLEWRANPPDRRLFPKNLDDFADRSRRFEVTRFVAGLSEDAATVARMLLDLCQDASARRDRSEVLRLLLDTGWPGERVARAIREVREALWE